MISEAILSLCGFEPAQRVIAIFLRAGPDAEIVQVPIQSIETVTRYYRDHAEELDDARIREIQQGLSALLQDWDHPSLRQQSTLQKYRESVVENAFVRGLGRISYARVGNEIYPCVHEDREGALSFLVPRGIERFQIRERKDLPETPFFPSQFQIQVRVAQDAAPSSESINDNGESENRPEAESAPESDASENVETSEDSEDTAESAAVAEQPNDE